MFRNLVILGDKLIWTSKYLSDIKLGTFFFISFYYFARVLEVWKC